MNAFYYIGRALLIAIALGVVAYLLLGKPSCKSEPIYDADLSYVQELQRVRDSAHAADAAKEQQYREQSARQQHIIDSMSVQLAVTKSMLNNSQARAAELAAGVIISKNNNDTASYVRHADSLASEVNTLNATIDRYEEMSTELFNVIDSMYEATAQRLQEKDALYDELQKSFDKVTVKYSVLHNSYEKAKKQKWSIGIGAGVGLTTDGKPGGAIGITISRTLIRL